MDLNLDYLYDFQKIRYANYLEKNLDTKTDLYVREYSNCYVLPVKKFKGMKFCLGGVVDCNYNEIKESFILQGENDKVMLGGKYDFRKNDVKVLKGEYVYLGMILNHWGHFLVDFCTRLWYSQCCKEKKFIFITAENLEFSFVPQIKRFIELLGIDINNVIVCNQVCLVEKIIIPQQAYQTNKYTSDWYCKVFDVVRSNIQPSMNYKKSNKVYFSRKKFCKALNTEINIELMDNLFENNKYSIIYPENLSLDDQIAFINDCDELAMISGTLVHNLLFIDPLKRDRRIYIMNKTYIVNCMMLDTIKIKKIYPIMVDCFASKYPVSLGHGPFMIVSNELLHKFIDKYLLDSYDVCCDSESHMRDAVSKYEFLYHKINYLGPNKRLFEFEESSPLSYSYFDVKNIYVWIKDFTKYELLDKKIYDFYGSYKSISDSLLANRRISSIKFKNIIEDKYMIYSVHVSNMGWVNFSFDGNYCGFLDTLNVIEAFVIKAPINLKYRCYYEDSGWSDYCGNAQICGVCGIRKKIQGLCITTYMNINFEYRIYNVKDGWSNFYKKGTELISLDGFSALEIKYL